MIMNNRLTELIEQKSFNELSAAEKSFVLEHISEREYNEQYNLISDIKKELKSEASQLKANDSIRLNALAALRAKQLVVESKPKVSFFNSKIPLWTAIAAVFMIFILTTYIFIDTQFKENKSSELVASIDTVYIDKIIRDTIEIMKSADTVVKTVYAPVKEVNPITINSQSSDYLSSNLDSTERENLIIQRELGNTMRIGSYTNTIDFKNPSSGKSLSNDPIGRVVLNVTN